MVYSKHALVQLLNNLDLIPNKNYGQNFLIDRTLCETFAQSATLDPDKDIVLEIGPGLGQVTEFLIDQCQQLYVIEIDKTCARFLEKKYRPKYPTARISGRRTIQLGECPATAHLMIVEGDALAVPFPPATKIVSSVPYSICYKLLLKIIKMWHFESAHLILQQEFINHILAETGNRGYTVMSVFAGLYLHGERILAIPNEAFFPIPDVKSLIVKFTPKPTIAPNATEVAYREKFLAFLEGLFPYITWPLKRAAKIFQEKKPKIAMNFQHLTRTVERSEYKDTWIRNIPPEGLFRIMVESLHYIP